MLQNMPYPHQARTCSSWCARLAASDFASLYRSKCWLLASSALDSWLLLDVKRHSSSVTCSHVNKVGAGRVGEKRRTWIIPVYNHALMQ